MSKSVRVTRGLSVVGLAASAAFLPVVAFAADEPAPVNKAQVEYVERQATPNPPKAQVEHDERSDAGQPGRTEESTSGSSSSGGLDAPAWQLALSAAGGAVVAGAAVVGTSRVRRHQHSAVA